MPPDAIDTAAQAFDASIAAETGAPAPKTTRPSAKDITEGPPERLFSNVGDLEVDEDSPPVAGGDAEDDAKEKKPPEPPEEEEEEAEEEDDTEDEDSEEAEETDEADQEFLAQEVEVIVDGEPQTVKLKEALEGYVRTQTFHKRMNEVEEAKKIISRTAQDAVANYEYTLHVAQEVEGYLKSMVPPEPNWDEEFKKNPIKARETQKYYEQVNEFRKGLSAKLTEAAQKQEESSTIQLNAFAAEESRKFDAMNAKQWSTDPKRKGRDLQAMRRTALTQGFSEEELSQVYDSRMLQVLLKASRYDRMMASKPKPVVKTLTKQVPSGTGPARTKRADKGFKQAMTRLNKTGSIDDAAVVFDKIIRRN